MNMKKFSHTDLMQEALNQAEYALKIGEIPIGATLYIPEDNIFFSSGNSTIADHDVTSHAEISCIRQASKHYKNHRLNNSILFVTLAPCIMCTGALIQARVTEIYIAVKDSRENSIHKEMNLFQSHYFNHKIKTHYGLLKEQSEILLRTFFDGKRT